VSTAEKANVLASNLLRTVHVCLEPQRGTDEILEAFRSLFHALLYFKDQEEQEAVEGIEIDRQA
jgi:hypothetical protein